MRRSSTSRRPRRSGLRFRRHCSLVPTRSSNKVPFCCGARVRSWHETAVVCVPTNVCSWWKSGHEADITARPILTFRCSAQPKSRTATGAQRAPEWHLAVRLSSGMLVTSRARAGFQGATHCDKDFSTLSTERVDRAQWRHTIRIVHRHRRAFQRGRRGATLRKGRSMMGQARQCTCAEGQRTGRAIDRSEPCHGWLLMR
jgi:hypothetical protein